MCCLKSSYFNNSAPLTITCCRLLWRSWLWNVFTTQNLWDTKALCGLWAWIRIAFWVCLFAQRCNLSQRGGRAKGEDRSSADSQNYWMLPGRREADSERERSKKSFGNYLQLWACFVSSHTHFPLFFFFTARWGVFADCPLVKSAALVRKLFVWNC